MISKRPLSRQVTKTFGINSVEMFLGARKSYITCVNGPEKKKNNGER